MRFRSLNLPAVKVEPIDAGTIKQAALTPNNFKSLYAVRGELPEAAQSAFIDCILPLLRLDPTFMIETRQDRFVVIGNSQISNDKIIALIEKSVQLGSDLAGSGVFG